MCCVPLRWNISGNPHKKLIKFATNTYFDSTHQSFCCSMSKLQKNKTKHAQSKIWSSLFIEKVGFLFLNEVYCLVFRFVFSLHLSPLVSLEAVCEPLYFTCSTMLDTTLLVGNTDCVNLLYCSLWPLNIVANKLRQNIDCVSLSRFVGAATLGQTLKWDFRVEIGFSLSIVSYLFCYFERQGKFSRKLSYSVLKKKNPVTCCI